MVRRLRDKRCMRASNVSFKTLRNSGTYRNGGENNLNILPEYMRSNPLPLGSYNVKGGVVIGTNGRALPSGRRQVLVHLASGVASATGP